MRYCEKCGVHVIGALSGCPLCEGPLTGEASPDVYPSLPFTGRSLLLRLVTLGTFTAVTVCTAFLLCLPAYHMEAIFCIAGLISSWFMVTIAVKKRGKPLKAIFWQVCILSVLLCVWDYGTGCRGWSLNYALPILYLCTMAAMVVIARLLRLQPSDYLLYLLLHILLGLAPLVLLLCGRLHVVYPAVICAAASAVLLVTLILFQGTALKSELLRRLHL